MQRELYGYRIERLRFVLNERGMPEAAGIRCLFISPFDLTERELDRVSEVLEISLDTASAPVYTEEQNGNDDKED